MTDRAYIVSRTLENKIAIAENNGQNTLLVTLDVLKEILALLKEQDEKPMIENEIGWNCPSCGMNLIGKTSSGYPCDLIDLPEDEPIHFCPNCGQAVKWNE